MVGAGAVAFFGVRYLLKQQSKKSSVQGVFRRRPSLTELHKGGYSEIGGNCGNIPAQTCVDNGLSPNSMGLCSDCVACTQNPNGNMGNGEPCPDGFGSAQHQIAYNRVKPILPTQGGNTFGRRSVVRRMPVGRFGIRG